MKVARALAMAAMSGMLLAAGGAAAQTEAQEALGARVAHTMFQAIHFDAVIAKAMEGVAGNDSWALKSRPEWPAMLKTAMSAEVVADIPKLETMLGHVLAQKMSEDELQAGVVIIADPAIQKMLGALSESDQAPKDVKPSRQTENLANTRAGRGFLDKFSKLETYLAPLQDDFVAEVLPGAFRRFADMVDASEAKRKAARP